MSKAAFVGFVSAACASLAAGQQCAEALLPFDRAAGFVDGEPAFDCFSCTPDPLESVRGSARCADGDIPEFNLTVSCSETCQSMIDEVFESCPDEEFPGDFHVLEKMHVADTFFQVWGLCDFRYAPTVCDKAILDYNRVIKLGGLRALCLDNDDPPAECDKSCRNEIRDLLDACDGKQFVVRDGGDLLLVGQVVDWQPAAPGVQELFWDELNPACRSFALDVATPDPTAAPIVVPDEPVYEYFDYEDDGTGNRGSKDDEETNLGAIIGGAVGGVAVVTALAAVVFFRHRRNSNANKAENVDMLPIPKGDQQIPQANIVTGPGHPKENETSI